MFARADSPPSSPSFVLTRYKKALGREIRIDLDNIADSLGSLALWHFQKFSFNTLYFNLKGKEDAIQLRQEYLIQQLITGQGGSCYHHNAVFQAILKAHDIESYFVACLVRNPGKPEDAFDFPTHIAIIFKHEGKSYLFDPGWDGTSRDIYRLPTSGGITRQGNYQVKKTDNPAYGFTFEAIKSDGSIVPRYDFSDSPTKLKEYTKAVSYLNSKDYAFYTLFLFTQINSKGQVIRLINEHLIIQDLQDTEIATEKLPEGSLMEKLEELLGPQKGMMGSIAAEGFKNPELGRLVCSSERSSEFTL